MSDHLRDEVQGLQSVTHWNLVSDFDQVRRTNLKYFYLRYVRYVEEFAIYSSSLASGSPG